MRKISICSKVIYHIYNRGASKMDIFLNDDDYRYFQYKIAKYKNKYSIKIITYCLMPNHYHLLLYTEDQKENIPKFMHSLQLSSAMRFNKKYPHSGHVFQGRYRNIPVLDPVYMQRIIEYINENPVRKKLVKLAKDWPYTYNVSPGLPIVPGPY